MSIIIYTLGIGAGPTEIEGDEVGGRLIDINEYVYWWIIVLRFLGEITWGEGRLSPIGFFSFGLVALLGGRGRFPSLRRALGHAQGPIRSRCQLGCSFVGLRGRWAQCSCWRITIHGWIARSELWDGVYLIRVSLMVREFLGGASEAVEFHNSRVRGNVQPTCQASSQLFLAHHRLPYVFQSTLWETPKTSCSKTPKETWLLFFPPILQWSPLPSIPQQYRSLYLLLSLYSDQSAKISWQYCKRVL